MHDTNRVLRHLCVYIIGWDYDICLLKYKRALQSKLRLLDKIEEIDHNGTIIEWSSGEDSY